MFGRSIGGITACHLASKYSDLVELLVIDRSMDELTGIAEQKLNGTAIPTTYNLLYKGLICRNAQNYVRANKCYKIITCDPLDDTVGPFQSTMAGVARQCAKHDYTAKEWRLFFQSLCFLIETEDKKYREYDFDIGEYEEEIIKITERLEQEMRAKTTSVSTLNVSVSEIYGTNRVSSSRPISTSFLTKQKAIINSDQEGEFFQVLLMVAMMVSDLQAATLRLRDVIGVNARPRFEEFVQFLQLAEVYGGGYDADVSTQQFNHR